MLSPLPIDAVLPALIASLRAHPCAVLQAPTGAGKTTRVPPALLAAGLAGHKQIVMVEPRRIAARGAAIRIAQEAGERIGSKIGYAVRFDRQAGSGTRILVVTPGILLRMLQEDPYMERIGILVFDEFHERGLECDLALGMARLVRETVQPELKIVVMSATLDAQNASAYLDGCPILTSEGRSFPVEAVYQPKLSKDDDLDAAVRAVDFLLRRTAGDLLVFLPDLNEIRQMQDLLEPLSRDYDLAVLPLYGDLPPERQDAALQPQDRRRIVLATNVAETSVTVEGITGVVDTGTAWQMIYDPSVGLDRLERVSISQASTVQRMGRAGRTQPGVCVRLWSEPAQRARVLQTAPEIRRIDLAGAVLALVAFGEADPRHFPWLDAPHPAAVDQAVELLNLLGALNGLEMTELGQRMAKLPAHPRLARLLLSGLEHGILAETALAAALLSERDPFPRGGPRGEPSHSDLWDKLEALHRYEQTNDGRSRFGELNRVGARHLFQTRNQFCRLTTESDEARSYLADGVEASLGKALLAAYPDRLCKRRSAGSAKALMVGGRGTVLLPQSAVRDAALFLALDIEAGDSEARVRMAHGVERDWLPREHINTSIFVEWDDSRERIAAFKRTRFLDLTLDENPAQVVDSPAATRLLLERAADDWTRIMPADDSAAASFLVRWRFLREALPEAELPEPDGAFILELAEWLAPGCRSFEDLRKADWLSAFRQKLGQELWTLIEREAPESIAVPSGSRIALKYEAGRPPVLAVRIQELFGLSQTPRVAMGNVGVLMHLLGPNYRPQQITEDLASFWKKTYPLVRKELRIKYPKHSWPEDPHTAEAVSRPKRRT